MRFVSSIPYWKVPFYFSSWTGPLILVSYRKILFDLVHGFPTNEMDYQLGHFCPNDCAWCGSASFRSPKTNILTRIPGIFSVNVCSGHKKRAKRFKISRFQVLWEPQMIDYANFIFQIKTMPNKVLTVSDFESFSINVSLKKEYNFNWRNSLVRCTLGLRSFKGH